MEGFTGGQEMAEEDAAAEALLERLEKTDKKIVGQAYLQSTVFGFSEISHNMDIMRNISGFLGTYLLSELAGFDHVMRHPFPYHEICVCASLADSRGDLLSKLIQYKYPSTRDVKLILDHDELMLHPEKVYNFCRMVVNSDHLDRCSLELKNVKRRDFYTISEIFDKPTISNRLRVAFNMSGLKIDPRPQVAPYFAENYRWLKRLNIDLDNDCREILEAVCERTGYLRSLCIKKDEAVELDPETIECLAKCVPIAMQLNSGELKSVQIANIYLSDDHRERIIKTAITEPHTLSSISMVNTGLTDEDCSVLFNALRVKSSIRLVTITDNEDVTDTTGALLLDMLNKNEYHLHTLRMERCDLDFIMVQKLVYLSEKKNIYLSCMEPRLFQEELMQAILRGEVIN